MTRRGHYITTAKAQKAADIRTLDERIDRLISFYESRRIRNSPLGDLEPSWALAPFTSLFAWKNGERAEEDRADVELAVTALELSGLHDGRLYEEGYKVGTGSWVFMGRALPDQATNLTVDNGIVIVSREPSPSTIKAMRGAGCTPPTTPIWIAYSLSEPFHLTGVGPCNSFEEVCAWIPFECEP